MFRTGPHPRRAESSSDFRRRSRLCQEFCDAVLLQVHEPSFGTKQTRPSRRSMSASLIGRLGSSAFRLSTNSSVDVAHGLSLLFGLGTKGPSIMGFEDEAEQSFGRPCRQSNGRNQADIRTHLIHRPARDILPPVDLRLPPDALILGALHAAAVSLVQWNSVPSIQMRCRITANRRAKATIAFFIPRRLAICMAQALSQDHFFERSMLCAAS